MLRKGGEEVVEVTKGKILKMGSEMGMEVETWKCHEEKEVERRWKGGGEIEEVEIDIEQK